MDSKLCVRKIDLTQPAGEVLGQFVKATAMDALACGDTQCLAWLRSLCLTIRYNLPFNALATLNMAITLTNSMTDSQLDTLKDEVTYSPITRHGLRRFRDSG